MRIIAGRHRGRKLLPPAGNATRPITDRAKQSLFDILAPNLPEAIVYDLFAGTGSLGLECLSRGSKSVTFFESERSAVERLQQNLATLEAADAGRIVRTDLFRYFTDSPTPTVLTDLVFLDPPYRYLIDHADQLRQLSEKLSAKHLAPSAILVFRHDIKDKLELPGLTTFDLRDYGEMRIELLHLCT